MASQETRRWWRGAWAIALSLSLIAIPVSAQTDDELQEWYEAWEARDLDYHHVDDWWFSSGTDEDEFWETRLADLREEYPCRRVIGSWGQHCEPTTTTTRPRPTTTTTRAPTTTTTKPPTTTTTVATTTTTSDGVYRGMGNQGSDVEQWRGLVTQFFQSGDVQRALRVMCRESGGNPNALNSSNENPQQWVHGLYQQRAIYWPARAAAAGYPGASWYNAEANIAVAAKLVYDPGNQWNHWGTSGPAPDGHPCAVYND